VKGEGGGKWIDSIEKEFILATEKNKNGGERGFENAENDRKMKIVKNRKMKKCVEWRSLFGLNIVVWKKRRFSNLLHRTLP